MTEIASLNTAPPKISVLMPVYNGAAFVEQSIESVLAQSFIDFELVIVNDGSTDDTPAILRGLAAKDARIRIVTKPNSGISETLNAGLAVARAPWIARLDADDLMLPQRLERQWAFVSADPGVVAAGSYYEIVNSQGEGRGILYPLPRNRDELAAIMAARDPLSFTHPTMIYLRDVATCLGGYRKAYEPCEDADLFARMLAEGGIILIQPEVLTRYRVHPGSISSRKMTEQFTTLRFIYHNFYAARDNKPVLSHEAFLDLRQRRPLGEKLQERLLLVSEYFYRAYTTAKVEGHKGKALACLAIASALRPYKALRRGLRGLTAKGNPQRA
jgi:glycosyltransferase involved in cell wall biosynthesis